MPKAEPAPEPRPEPVPAQARPQPEPVEPKAVEPQPVVAATRGVAGEPNAAAVRSMWTTVREKVRERSRTTEVMLAGAIVRAVEGDTLVLSHESAPLAKRLSEQRNADVIREALKDALGVDWKIRCEAGAASDSRTAVSTTRPLLQRRRSATTKRRACWPRPATTTPKHRVATRRKPPGISLQSELGARRIDGADQWAAGHRREGVHHGRSGKPAVASPVESSLTARTWCS